MKSDSARDKAMDKLVEAKLRSGLNPGGSTCLDAEILAAYVERTLTSRERANCELHLVSCARCQEQVATLVRLSEADEPASSQAETATPARAAGINWFRWAWAGPALAAMLVMGIYLGGPFIQDIRQAPGTEDRIQKPVKRKPATVPPGLQKSPSEMDLPPNSRASNPPKSQPPENKLLDSERHAGATSGKPEGPQTEPLRGGSLGGITARREPVPKAQNEEASQAQTTVAPATPPAPAPATDKVAPAQPGAIATPSVRADLAKKDERGQSAGGAGISTPGAVGGLISGTPSNKPSANGSTSNLATAGRNGKALTPQPAAQTANEKTRPRKAALYDDGKAKEEKQKNDSDSAVLHQNDRDNKQSSQSVSVSAATEQVMVTSAGGAPEWRVGRHGLIQKLDAKGKWKKQKSGVHADLLAIAFSSPDSGWAVGRSGTILQTTDGGATWSQLPSPTTEDLVRVTATSEQAANIVTRGGQTLTTTNGGATWSAAPH